MYATWRSLARETTMKSGSVVVLSGGQDSTTCLYWARRQFEGDLYAITFTYGQRHWQEVEAAKGISSSMFPRVTEHRIVDIHDYGELAKSALTSSSLEVRGVGGGHDG